MPARVCVCVCAARLRALDFNVGPQHVCVRVFLLLRPGHTPPGVPGSGCAPDALAVEHTKMQHKKCIKHAADSHARNIH